MKTNNYLFTLLSGVLAISTTPLSAEPTPTTTPQAATPNATVPVSVQPQASRTAFTSAILNREPVDQLNKAQTGQVINYFSELKGLQGHVITHRWEHNGQFKLGMQFPVNGQRWRVHSSKTLHHNMAGTWTVSVVNDDGSVLKKDTLTVTSGTTTTTATSTATPANAVKPTKTTNTPDNPPKVAQPQPAETEKSASQNKTPKPTPTQKKPAAQPVKPLMPELLEVQPPELTPPAKPSTPSPASTEEKAATDPARKPIWEVLPQ